MARTAYVCPRRVYGQHPGKRPACVQEQVGQDRPYAMHVHTGGTGGTLPGGRLPYRRPDVTAAEAYPGRASRERQAAGSAAAEIPNRNGDGVTHKPWIDPRASNITASMDGSAIGPVQAPPPSAAASGRRGAPVAGVMWPTIQGRATPCRRPVSKRVLPSRSRSSASLDDPQRSCGKKYGAAHDVYVEQPTRRVRDRRRSSQTCSSRKM